ncbi:MAG TPA: GntR family transcriptional regulator [Oceanobacillus sp.]|nr:GntR family transcriptional regulator [Oceanobacillus sp.]
MNKASDIQLYHDSFVSLHVQLHNQLRELIVSGRWQGGTRIPSENQLTSHLNISRSTLRLALQRAELEGLVERIPGKGTYVAHIAQKESQRRLIAFMTCGFDSETHSMLLNGAESVAKANGHRIIFSNAQSRQEETDILRRFREDNVVGLLLWPHANASRAQRDNTIPYEEIGVPMVLMDRQIHGLECDCVTSDNYGGGVAMMRHFLELGHQRIVFLSHQATELLTFKERYRAYRDVLTESGLPVSEAWLIGQPGKEIGASLALRASLDPNSLELQQIRDLMLNANPRPTAIFALNDYLAVLAMQAMRTLNLPVPDAVSIGGFDDIDLAAHLQVPLTTVAQDSFAIGKLAAQRLIDRLEGYSGPAHCEIIPTELRIRSSTGVVVTA